jgi:CubicO group peptidase (beta-lactamase class C family)
MPQAVESEIESRIADGKLVGIVIGIVTKDGTTFHAYGEKQAGKEDLPDENTVFEIGSVSKVFTGILLADAVSRGEVAYTDPIEKYLPEDVTAPTRNDESITLEHLSVQTSGLPRMPSNFKPKNSANPFADYTYEQLYEYLGDAELESDIGEEFAYSNTGVGLLGHLLERATGKSYEALIVERIATPLNMPDTSIALSTDQKSRLAYGHIARQQAPNWDIPTLAGAGAIRSTAKDMTVFLAANLGHIDTPLHAAMDESHRPQANAGPNMQIGLGWLTLATDGPGPIVWHNGGTGGYRSFAGFVKETGIGVVVLTNISGAGHDDIGYHLLDPTVPLQKTDKRAEVTVDVDTLKRYTGKYQLTPELIFDVDLDGTQLRVQVTGQPRIPVYPESEVKFFYKVVDAQLTFQVDDDGNVTGLILHQGGANQPVKRIMRETDKPAEVTVEIHTDTLQRYVGKYELAPEFIIDIGLNGSQLSAQATGQGRNPIYPESETKFFLKGVDAQLTFQVDDDGKVTGLTLHQGGANQPAKRIE